MWSSGLLHRAVQNAGTNFWQEYTASILKVKPSSSTSVNRVTTKNNSVWTFALVLNTEAIAFPQDIKAYTSTIYIYIRNIKLHGG
jgi:hypothetical protein